MDFDTSKETVLLELGDDTAIVKRGSQVFHIDNSKLPDDISIGDRFNDFKSLDNICTSCNNEKMYDEKNQVYYCPKCE